MLQNGFDGAAYTPTDPPGASLNRWRSLISTRCLDRHYLGAVQYYFGSVVDRRKCAQSYFCCLIASSSPFRQTQTGSALGHIVHQSVLSQPVGTADLLQSVVQRTVNLNCRFDRICTQLRLDFAAS